MQGRDCYQRHFGVEPLDDRGKSDIWPTYAAGFIRRPREADAGDEAVAERETLPGQFGLIPHWATDTTIAQRTFNARSETVTGKRGFRDAWEHGQRCIIPAEAIFEPGWRSGQTVPTRNQVPYPSTATSWAATLESPEELPLDPDQAEEADISLASGAHQHVPGFQQR